MSFCARKNWLEIMVHGICFKTGSVISFPSCLMDEIRWWQVFLCLVIGSKTFHCIIHCSSVTSVFRSDNVLDDCRRSLCTWCSFFIFNFSILVFWFNFLYCLSLFLIIIFFFFNFSSYPGLAIFWLWCFMWNMFLNSLVEFGFKQIPVSWYL